jgi:hypothetical protein
MSNDGGQAFPRPNVPGMTLRDWYAGQALAGLLANPNRENNDNWSWQTGTLTGDAYQYADDMLAERERRK